MDLLLPGFLWGLFGISVPLIIHLLQLRKPQRVQFTNIGFIQEIEFKAGRQRLQDLLVLTLRMLAITGLVLAFCQPYIPTPSGANPTKGEIQIFVDNSRSMRVLTSGHLSLEDEALKAANTIAGSYNSNARLLLLGHSTRVTLGNTFKTAVSQLPQSIKKTGWGSTTVRQSMNDSSDKVLYVVSDFQKSEGDLGALQHIAANKRVILMPLAPQPTGNVYVDSVWLNDAFVRAGVTIGLHIRLRNGGGVALQDCPVKVETRKQQIATYQVAVPAGQTVETVVQVQVPNEQLVTGQVVTGDAPVVFDNAYFFTLQPATAVRVVEVGPMPVTQAAYRNEPLFRYSYMRAQQANFNELQKANIVILSEPLTVDTGLRDALVAVVRRGGSVVLVPSALPQVHESYAQLLRVLGAGGVQWENSIVGEPVRQEVAMPNPHSPFFKEVFGAQPRQIALPEVSPILQLTGGGTDILHLRDGQGFLTEFGQGAGRVYIFSAPFDKQYSDFMTHALFVPVLYRLAMLSYRNDQPLAYRVGEQTITLPVPNTRVFATGDGAYRLVHDSLTLVPGQRLQGQQVKLEIPAELSTPGFYQLQYKGQTVATLAFNEAKGESELATYSVAELRQMIGPKRPNVQILDVGEQPTALQHYRAEQTGRPLWQYCLLLVLACLLAESAVLRWGRHTRQPIVAKA